MYLELTKYRNDVKLLLVEEDILVQQKKLTENCFLPLKKHGIR